MIGLGRNKDREKAITGRQWKKQSGHYLTSAILSLKSYPIITLSSQILFQFPFAAESIFSCNMINISLKIIPKNQFWFEQYKPHICVSLSQFWKLASQLFSKCGNLLFLILKVTRMRNISQVGLFCICAIYCNIPSWTKKEHRLKVTSTPF